jgi:hydrogenase nickel incorporation protein HypA/HybF
VHELSICQGLMREVMRVAEAQRAERVLSITLEVGPLAGIEPSLLESAYPLVAAGTCAAGARLLIERTALEVRCLGCGATSEVEVSSLVCRACGSWRVEVVSGEELVLASLELERADE